nr:uncharacterized protein LOC105318360 isoform X2 [Crassostrea gigas]
MPQLTYHQIEQYFLYRMAEDKQMTSDLKALEKGKDLLNGERIFACSMSSDDAHIYLSGIVGAAMKQKLSYNFKIGIDKRTGDPLNSHCECPAGKGPHGTCKHVAAVFLMVESFVEKGNLAVRKGCTDNLQSFHVPKKIYDGKPLAADRIPWKRKHTDEMLEDPRKDKYMKFSSGYSSYIYNCMVNFCSQSSTNISLRYLTPSTSLQVASRDHDYLQQPITEHLVDKAVAVSPKDAKDIEKSTRMQAKSKTWFDERKWRITASRFGDIVKMTCRRDTRKLCCSIYQPKSIITYPIIHGRQHESRAISMFEELTHFKVKKCGLFVSVKYPFLGATPDGLVENDAIVEVKCPYGGRDVDIKPGKKFPFLVESNGKITLKSSHKYYDQIQGQLYISGRKLCYFIVYTFCDILILKLEYDEEYCVFSLLPKLEIFYKKHFRPYVASCL